MNIQTQIRLKRRLKTITKKLGQDGARVYQLLCELADEDGQIRFEGSEEDMIREIQKLYAVRYGGQFPNG